MRNTRSTQLLFELSQARPPRRAAAGVRRARRAGRASCLPAARSPPTPPPLPEVAEPDVVRHFTNLSTLNMSVDTHFYPLGSCTMKYNPKRNERLAGAAGHRRPAPAPARRDAARACCSCSTSCSSILAEIAGLAAVSLQPAAGAHGELTALLVAAAYFRDQGETRTKVLVPDSAHGTNPASAAMAGFDAVTVKSNAAGFVDLDDLAGEARRPDRRVHDHQPEHARPVRPADRARSPSWCTTRGGLIYLDGANMNAILGITRPGDFGADMMHYNAHKTFSGPHGGGGPGAGPIARARDARRRTCRRPWSSKHGDALSPRLRPAASRSAACAASSATSASWSGRTATSARTGPTACARSRENAVLNANYLLSRVKHILPVPHGDRCMHEFVASGRARSRARSGVSAMDIAKRLLDYGFHAPTVYFPLIVPEAMMIEPTETESKETLDAFAETLFRITEEPADLLHEAPHTTLVSRPDEVQAARQPILRWHKDETKG